MSDTPSIIGTVPNAASIDTIIYTPQASAVCAIGKAPFHAQAVITYHPNALLLEFESFERWLHSISMTNTTIEGLTRLIFDALVAVLGDIPLEVTLHASTAVHAPVTATIRSGKGTCCEHERLDGEDAGDGCCSGGSVYRSPVHCGCGGD